MSPITKRAGLIRDIVAEAYDVKPESLSSSSRLKTLAEARQVYMMLVRDLFELSYPEIGLLVNRDHTTVIDGIRSLRARLQEPSVARKVKYIREKVKLLTQGMPINTENEP